MKLSDGLEIIKQTFPLALSGALNHMFTPDEVEKVIKLGFLLNNLTIDTNKHPTELLFEYNDFRVCVVVDSAELSFGEDFYIYSIIRNEVFIKALNSFKRDNKLNEIL